MLKRYELQLDNPFQRALAVILLEIVACHHTIGINQAEWYDPESKTTTNLQLTSAWTETHFQHDEIQRAEMETLQKLVKICSDSEYANRIFEDMDTNHSGVFLLL